jgi:transposase
VILDNLIAHKSKAVRNLLIAHGCPLLFLPTYTCRRLRRPFPR